MLQRLLVLFVSGACVSWSGCAAPSSARSQASSAAPAQSCSLDAGLQDLSLQIVSNLAEGGKSKVAVIEFSNLDGHVTQLGKFFAEELLTRLYVSKRVEVVERSLLNKVIRELELNVSGYIDDESAKSIGRLTGVDALASGSVTDLGRMVKVNARLIATETGAVFAAASASICKDETIGRLLSAPSSPMPQDSGTSVSTDARARSDQSKARVGLPRIGGHLTCADAHRSPHGKEAKEVHGRDQG